jgi:hypothetical protein
MIRIEFESTIPLIVQGLTAVDTVSLSKSME